MIRNCSSAMSVNSPSVPRSSNSANSIMHVVNLFCPTSSIPMLTGYAWNTPSLFASMMFLPFCFRQLIPKCRGVPLIRHRCIQQPAFRHAVRQLYRVDRSAAVALGLAVFRLDVVADENHVVCPFACSQSHGVFARSWRLQSWLITD